MKLPGPDGSGLTFAWDKPERWWLWLPGFFLLSLFAHAATFVVFRVVYPERATIPPAPPQVSLLTPTTSESAALLQRIATNDPALVAAEPAEVPRELLNVPYQPSYSVIRTQPRTLSEQPLRAEFPPAKPPLELIQEVSGTRAPPPPPAASHPTSFHFGDELAARVLPGAPALALSKKATAPLEWTEFLIGVSDRGEVRHTFLQGSSGDDRVDADAAKHVSEISFAPSTAAMTWGSVTVAWGIDAYELGPQSP